MRIGVLTGGGDCPGLNAVIRAIVRKGVAEHGHEFVGFRDGWRGPLEGDYRPLGIPEVRGILPRGGTILGSSRTNPMDADGGAEKIAANLAAERIEGLIAIGGEDTLGAASRLQEAGIDVIGVPKTIDNDLGATDYTFGFDTAVNIAMEAIDRLHTTAESHHRVLIIEVMGRHAGWIAFHAGLAGGANVILIPEHQFDLEQVCHYIERRFESEYSPIVVVAEGAEPKGGMPPVADAPRDQFGHVRLGGIAHWLEGEIERQTGKEARATVLGHVQRGGTPTAFDRVLATRFGLHAIDAAHNGEWGMMTALRGTEIVLVPLGEATAELKLVPESLYREAEVFFGVKGRLALAGAAALALACCGCADDRDVGSGGGSLTVYVSSPLHGPRAGEGRAIADGARLALEQARGRVGEIRVRGVYLDDTDGGDWSIARTAANARRAAADVTTIGYLGELDSGATRVSLPITNQAGIVQVSPGSTAVDLTRLPPAGDARPERLLPSERETFARVVPDDEVQGRAAALWAERMGAARGSVVLDGTTYGDIMAEAFAEQASRLGLPLHRIRTGRKGTEALPQRLSKQRPEAVYLAATPEWALPLLVSANRTEAAVIGPDALITPAFLGATARFTRAFYVTSQFLDPALLPPRGQRFLRAFRSRFGRPAAPSAAYGYEAMALLLDSIRRAGDDGDRRDAVVDELLATPERKSVLGTYAIDGNGDTTLDSVTGYQVADGLPVFPVLLLAPR